MTSEPFVGRVAELERLREAFDRALEGRGGLVMITGDPGIGKTRLARELERYASEHSATVLWGRSHEAGGAPAYWPWVQALRSLIKSSDDEELRSWLGSGASEVARIVPSVRERLDDLSAPEPIADPGSAQFLLFDAVTTFIASAARTIPLVFVLDDLHWADRSSLLLLEHAALELGRARVLVVGTYRDVELGRQHPLEAALAGIGRAERFQTIDLRGLSEADVAAYARVATGVEPSSAAARSIYHATEGNAFFLQEVVAQMAQEGALASGEVSVPPSVRAAIGRRLNALPEACNELLLYAAVVGREFSHELLARLVDDARGQVPELLEAAQKAGLIEGAGAAAEYRFTHALIQETLLDEVPAAQRVRLHARIAETLEQLLGNRAAEHAAELAPHFVQSAVLGREQAERAVRYSRLAAEQAEALFGWDEAARHYEPGLALVSEADDRLGEDEAALYEAHGRCRLRAGQLRAGWRSLMRAITLYRERGDGIGHARAVLELPATYNLPAERIAGIVDAALVMLGDDDPHTRARLLVARALTLVTGAEQAAEEAASLARAHSFEDVLGLLLRYEAMSSFGTVPPGQQRRLFRQAHDALASAGDSREAASAIEIAAWVSLWEGDLDEAAAAATRAAEYARSVGSVDSEQATVVYLANIALLRCEFERMEELAATITASGPALILQQTRASHAEMAGELERAIELTPDPGAFGSDPVLSAILHCERARLMLNAGRDEDARREFAKFVELMPRLPARFFRAAPPMVLDTAAPQLGDERWVRTLYDEYTSYAETEDDRLRVTLSAPGRGFDALKGALALRLDLVDEAAEHYRSGLEWAERERCPVEAGRCYQGLAEVAERRGQRRETLAHLEAAEALFEPHGAKLYLDQVRRFRDDLPTRTSKRSANPAGLTDREVEVIGLVVAGRSSREIGDELTISYHTVTRHLNNIYGKLNVSGRAEAAAWAVRNGVTVEPGDTTH